MKYLILGMVLSLPVFADSFVVKVKDITIADATAKLQKLSVVESVSPFSPFQLEETKSLLVVESENVSLKEKLASLKFIESVEENFDVSMYEVKTGPNTKKVTDDLLSKKQWGLKIQDQVFVEKNIREGNVEYPAASGIDIQWNSIIESIESKMKRNPLVAVLDMGIDLNHPDLKHAIYKNPKECDENGNVITSERIDRDNNKLPGDCHGWNFAAQAPYQLQYPIDDVGHGTHISGIMAAKRNNKIGIAGVSDKIKILPIRVVGAVDKSIKERKRIMMSSASQRIANGVYYAALMGADVINLSLGWPRVMDTKFMRQAFKFAHSRGAVIVAAAGNDGGIADVYPCNYPGVICVGAVQGDGKITDFSNYGGQVDVVAPGDDILSTIPMRFTPLNKNITGYDYGTGTSQAAPFVSASLAILKASFPTETISQLKMRLYSSTKDISHQGKSLNGLLQLEDAYKNTREFMIRPVLKGFDTITFKQFNKPTPFKVNFESLGSQVSGLKIEVSSLTPGVKILTKNFDIEKNEDTRFSLNLSAAIAKNAPEYLKFKMKLSYEGIIEEYVHHVNIGRNIFAIKGVKALTINTKNLKIPLINRDSNRVFSILKQIPTVLENGSATSYYVEKTNRVSQTDAQGNVSQKETGRTFYLLNRLENEIVLTGSYTVADSRKMILLQKADFDYDGKDDYLMANIVMKEGSNNGEIVYDYLNEKFELKKRFVYAANDSIYDRRHMFSPKIIRYRKECSEGSLSCIAIPVFTMDGRVPDRDQDLGPWDRFDDSVKVRAYTFYPVEKTKFEIHALLNLTEEKKLKSLTGNVNADIATVTILNQDDEAFAKGSVKILYTVGKGVFQTNIEGEVVNRKINYRKLSHKSRLRSNRFYESVNNGNYVYNPYPHGKLIEISADGIKTQRNNVFAEFVTEKQVKMMIWDGEQELISHYIEATRNEKIENVVAQYKLLDGSYASYLESSSSMIYLVGATAYKSKIKRFSFLPGHIMEEMHSPLALYLKDGVKPALYSDSTTVSIHKVSLKLLKYGHFQTYAGYNYHLPSSCVALDPIREEGSSKYQLNLICSKTNGGFQNFHIPFE